VAPARNRAAEEFRRGYARHQSRDYARARRHLEKAQRLDRAFAPQVEALLSNIEWSEGDYLAGLAAADRAIEADPNYSYAHLARADCCAALCRIEEACESRRRAVELQPHPEPHSNLLFEMNYLSQTTPEQIYAEARRWNGLYAAPLAGGIAPHTNTPHPERRLKIGYVSPDLCNHAVMRFFPPVVERHDRSRFEILVYAVGAKSDDVTEQFRSSVDNFVAMPGAGPEFAERVRADGIDILVDLAGHTMGRAFLGFALKPAPIQVSWLGALSTTGLDTMDYFLGDARIPCQGTEHLFSEKICRLPVESCYRPIADLPVGPSPWLEHSHITFGCFNNPRKITREAVKLWSAILHLAPGSRLLLKYRDYDVEAVRDRYRTWFAEDGIPSDRITFASAGLPLDYLKAFGEIDISLDPFPYNGGTTTLDSLWMGVPVVTMAGRLAVQCAGASLLSGVGLADLIAHSPEEYLRAALFLAEAVAKTPALRRNVREALQRSPLMDEGAVVRSVERAYREMWRDWCRSRSERR
jgi:predicted O-linked N-acetylglucosamine transferase (SPINDLY family)